MKERERNDAGYDYIFGEKIKTFLLCNAVLFVCDV